MRYSLLLRIMIRTVPSKDNQTGNTLKPSETEVEKHIMALGIEKANVQRAKEYEYLCSRNIGIALRKKRESLDLSLREVSRRMEKSAVHISDLEKGRRMWTEESIIEYVDSLSQLDSRTNLSL